MNPFDSVFLWNRQDAQTFYDLLIRDIATPGTIRTLFLMAGGRFADLNLGQPPRDIWAEALERLAPKGGVLLLCRRLIEAHRDLEELCVAAQALLDARPAVQDRFDPDGQILVDRAVLRDHLTKLGVERPRHKVLIVRGEPKSGKTWSRYLFERAASDRGADATYLNRDTVGSVREVIEKLFGIFDAKDRIPPVTSTASAWYRTVCNELAAVATRRVPQRQLWIAVDDLGTDEASGAPLMDPEIRAFFEQFVMHLPDPQTYRLFRLMLIHYPEEEPSAWESDECARDRTSVQGVCETDIVDVVKDWLRVRGRELSDMDLERFAGEVIAFANSAQPGTTKPWLQLVREELYRRLEQEQPV